MTLSKLAKLANVSVSVVSKAFSGKGGVSEEMREHVFTVAREHGCFAQFYHAPYDRPVVAVIIPEAISAYYIHYVEAMKKCLEANNCTMLLSISNFDPQMLDELVRYYTEHSKVDALVLTDNFSYLPSDCDTVTAAVTVDEDCRADIQISYDLSDGLREALGLLSARGHRRIAFIGEPLTTRKLAVMTKIMDELGIEVAPERMITSMSRFEEAGRDGVRRLLSLGDRPSAIFGAYGYITQGIIAELYERGIDPVSDLAVVSMDGDPSPISRELDVAHISSGIEEVCARIVYEICQRLDRGNRGEKIKIVIPSSFCGGELNK